MAWCQNQNNNLEEVFNYYTAFVNIASECLVVIENIGNCDCNGTNPCNEDVLLCELYDYLQNLIETCFSPLSVNGVYDYCDELECFYSFIKKIRVFDEEHPEYQILQGNILSLHDSYIQHYIQLKDWCANNNSDLIEVFQYYSSFVEIATSLANTVGDIGHCNCGEVQPCQKDPILCDLYTQLLGLFNNCFITLTANEEYLYCQELNCFSEFINLIKIFNEQYSEYALVANHLHDEYEQYNQQYGQLISWCSNPVTDASIVIDFYESFVANASNILSIIKDLGNCDCIEASGLSCTTSFQQVCWKTVQHYEYSQTIPSQAAVEEDTQAMIAGINTTAQPIWRPNTKYYIKFSLKDEVDNGQRPSGIFDYYYGFRTVGPVGHFHKYPNAYPIPDTVIIDGVSIKQSEVEFPLTSLRKYIDYNRSYPNADGNIILAKPLFYGNEQCKIDIYFEKPFAYHMLKTWQSYNGLPELKGAMHIAIKDPVSNTIIPYPLPQDWELNEYVPETILNGDNGWVSDEIPRYPVNIQLLIDYVNSVNANPNSIQCSINLGDLIKPASYIYSVTLTNLKPRKLYTALVYNAFDENGDGLFENQLDENNGIVYEESQKVHEFVFQTSRYQTFRDQVESYLLKEFDENNNLINEKQAVYEQRLALNLNQIENALALVSGGNTPETLAMETRFYHPFDRVIEGVFGIKPIDPAVTTDFIRIVDQNTGKLVALIIRNPEPFNNPRIPLNEIIDTVYVHLKLSEYPDTDYKVLYSKDYSQMIVMHVSKEIVRTSLRILFKYKVWDGSNYIVPDESSIPNDEKIYTIKKVIQIKQN
jgi:hypothetical protein